MTKTERLQKKIRAAYEEIAFGKETEAKLAERMKAMELLRSICEEETAKGAAAGGVTVTVTYR